MRRHNLNVYHGLLFVGTYFSGPPVPTFPTKILSTCTIICFKFQLPMFLMYFLCIIITVDNKKNETKSSYLKSLKQKKKLLQQEVKKIPSHRKTYINNFYARGKPNQNQNFQKSALIMIYSTICNKFLHVTAIDSCKKNWFSLNSSTEALSFNHAISPITFAYVAFFDGKAPQCALGRNKKMQAEHDCSAL